jgi:hypothetical protein
MSILLMRCRQEQHGINYLGQEPPGFNAEVFAAGKISTDSMEHSSPAFSPDGKVVLWTVLDRSYHASMMEMTFENGKWSAPHQPTFADSTADDYYPSFSPDGKKLYFSSRRKVPAGFPEGRGIRIWQVDRNENKWGRPIPFDTTVSKGENYAHSISKDGSLYYSASHGGAINWCLRKAQRTDDHYLESELLPYSINSVGYEDGPYIAPDESFLIFESQRPEGMGASGDLYISFKNSDGGWNVPVNMGQKINSTANERFARLSPDGKYLFFGSTRNNSATNIGFDILWIDAKIIDELKKEATAQSRIDLPLGQEILSSLLNNEIDSAARKLSRWLFLHPNSLDATVIYSSLLRKQKDFSQADVLLTGSSPSWRANTSIIMEKALVKFGMNEDNDAINLLAPILVKSDQLRERYIYLSLALLDMEKFVVSDDYFEKAMAIHASPSPYFRRGCAYARIGQIDRAFPVLERAFELGMRLGKEYEDNPDLTPLKSDARWKKLLHKMGG